MKLLFTILLLSFSAINCQAQLDKLKATAEFADFLVDQNDPKFIYTAFVLYDWYEDYRTKMSSENQLLLGLTSKKNIRDICANKVKSGSYSRNEKFMVDALLVDGEPSGYCQPNTTFRNNATGTVGSGVRFKTTEDILLAYSIMSQEQRQEFREVADDELTGELDKFEQQEFFTNFKTLMESGQLEKVEYELEEADQTTFQFSETDLQQLQSTEDLRLQIDDTQQTIQNLLNESNQLNDRKLERKLQKALEQLKESDLSGQIN